MLCAQVEDVLGCTVGWLICSVRTLGSTEKRDGIYMGAVKWEKLALLSRPAVAETQRWSDSQGDWQAGLGCSGLQISGDPVTTWRSSSSDS